ncbi:hypothetical protein EJ08DRAFT_273193 [Tothia fuscella]|uniref:Uncharacterized protein n=1 Tax=Tothia fuscella TaxID=1048955 RepID=A0A9P4NQB9_9PEZI|nr:hypothetical protein EJ08DRAFT_273193 [Tothia fuscella]
MWPLRDSRKRSLFVQITDICGSCEAARIRLRLCADTEDPLLLQLLYSDPSLSVAFAECIPPFGLYTVPTTTRFVSVRRREMLMQFTAYPKYVCIIRNSPYTLLYCISSTLRSSLSINVSLSNPPHKQFFDLLITVRSWRTTSEALLIYYHVYFHARIIREWQTTLCSLP